MYSKVLSGTLCGLEADRIAVEADVSFGFPAFSIVGLPDTAIRESKERVKTAIVNSGFRFPDKRVTVNLSPANLRKEGSHFDLPVALSILVASSTIIPGFSDETAFIGELTLDGNLRRVNGVLPMIIGLRDKGVKTAVIPAENVKEGKLVKGIDIFAAENLTEAAGFIEGKCSIQKVEFEEYEAEENSDELDFSQVSGQESAKRAIQIAAAALHNILLVGPPGSGKTMLAKRIPTIMPPLTYEEQLEITKIYSIYGILSGDGPMVIKRPFRAPDNTISPTAMTGGGHKVKPGEVSLAHLGVLFLDELPEFSRPAIEALRKPMEDEELRISRLSGSVVLPSKFLAVAAMNPCPCGFYGDSRNECTCSMSAIMRYRSRLSGPLLDRIDMTVNVSVPQINELRHRTAGTSSEKMRKEVMTAREMQSRRFSEESINYNSQMKSEHLEKYCRLDRETENLLNNAFNTMNLSVRSYDRILRVSRTIADMAGSENIVMGHVAEAISYKCEREIFR